MVSRGGSVFGASNMIQAPISAVSSSDYLNWLDLLRCEFVNLRSPRNQESRGRLLVSLISDCFK